MQIKGKKERISRCECAIESLKEQIRLRKWEIEECHKDIEEHIVEQKEWKKILEQMN